MGQQEVPELLGAMDPAGKPASDSHDRHIDHPDGSPSPRDASFASTSSVERLVFDVG